eukprot:TRINITY_DN12839_c0_g1_i1.p1 TRINITY_DN12839_c0_g1~~TRINITY_DN12839_c0_g1_i1.p1  ORF type:complete len:205 (-),score=30.90 TRINITY_DN12839_c0_g1_i1:219-812(-)
MDDGLKRSLIFDKLFQDLELITSGGESLIEKLPKILLCYILQYLNPKSLTNVFRLNKFFFKFLWTSPHSAPLWEHLCKKQFSQINLTEREVEQVVMNPTNDKYEQKMSRYFLYYKLGFQFEWDISNNTDKYEIFKKMKAIYKSNNATRTIASKTIFKGPKKYLLNCSYQTNKGGWFTFGILSSSYNEWDSYQYGGKI